MTEICMHCGRSVAWGSGNYVSRVPDGNTEEERKEMGMAHPEGDFSCMRCEEEYLRENGAKCEVCSNYTLDTRQWEGFKSICQLCQWELEKAIDNIQNEEWVCWTLSTDDIIGIAKQKGISLIDKDIDDIARRVKNGIQWSLDEQWESIVTDAIRDASLTNKEE